MESFLYVAMLLTFLGVVIRYLKWYWLLAGYNTMSKERKQYVDITGLGKFFSSICFIDAAILIIGSSLKQFEQNIVEKVVTTILLLSLAFLLIGSQKFDRKSTKINYTITSIIAFIVVVTIFCTTVLR